MACVVAPEPGSGRRPSGLVAQEPIEGRHEPLGLLDLRQVTALGEDLEEAVLEAVDRPVGLADGEHPVAGSPQDECRNPQFGKSVHQHLALPPKAQLATHGGQLGLQEAGQPRQPVLLLEPLSRDAPGAREDESRPPQRPLGGAGARPTPGGGEPAVSGQGQRPEGRADPPPEAGAGDQAQGRTRSGSDSARRRAARPPKELPTTAARAIPRTSGNAATKRSKKTGE